MSKPLNQNASKPPDQRVWGKGRITADLGTDLKGRLLTYARHEKRTMKEILIEAVEQSLAPTDPFRVTELDECVPFKVGDIVDCYRPPDKHPESRGMVVGGSPVSKHWVRVQPYGSTDHFSWDKDNLKLAPRI